MQQHKSLKKSQPYQYKLGAPLGNSMAASDIIWGSLLGDGHCNKRGCITLEGNVFTAPYTFWKWEWLRAAGLLTNTSTPRLVHRFDKRTGKSTHSLRFNTRTLWSPERRLFYKATPGGRECKVFPPLEVCRNRWTAAALAVWYMDDGGAGGNSKRGCVLDVSGYDESGRREAQRTLRQCFQLETSFQKSGKTNCKLFILRSSADRFRDLITPHIIPSMWYKCAHL